MATHKELNVWKLGMDIVEKIYKITNTFPQSEQFGLISQRLGFLKNNSIIEELTILKKKLINFIKYIKSSTTKPLNT